MEKDRLKPRYRWWELGALYVLWLALFTYILSIAWVSEDAYITFRVLDNFFAGYGLRWNIHERVQAYTHPLWMLLHIPLYAIWHNLFLDTIALSVVCSAAAVMVMLFAARKSVPMTLFFFFLPLVLAKSFIDYTSSGLENPLSYLLFAAFCYVLIRKQESPRFWFYCSLSVSLSLFNRLDTILLFAPALFYLVRRCKPVRWQQVAWGSAPLIAWFYFAFFYYGFLFPNTKYAKLNTGMSLWQYLSQGLYYAKYLLIWDTLGAIILLSCIAFLLPRRWLGWLSPPERLPRLPAFLGLGVLLYAFYVIYIGGDYMAGRFWALPIFAGICTWFLFLPGKLRPDVVFAAVCLMGAAFATPQQMENIRKSCSVCIPLRGRVINARFVFWANWLVVEKYPLKLRNHGTYPFIKGGRDLAREKPEVKKLYYIGMMSYYAGPQVKVIDELGLADPLLARLPASRRQRFYIGHFRRDLPKGYFWAVKTGSLERMQPALAHYYEPLRLITSGKLLDKERFKTILLFNIGYYDHWRREYLSNRQERKEAASGKAE